MPGKCTILYPANELEINPMHSGRSKLHAILAFLSAIGLKLKLLQMTYIIHNNVINDLYTCMNSVLVQISAL